MNTTINVGLVAMFCTLSVGCASESNSRVRIRSAVEAQRGALSACYADSLEVDLDTDGDMHVALSVDESGDVDDVVVSDGSVHDEEMSVCVATALSSIEMPRPPSEPARIAYTVRFRPRD